jgi:hypothetical protein
MSGSLRLRRVFGRPVSLALAALAILAAVLFTSAVAPPKAHAAPGYYTWCNVKLGPSGECHMPVGYAGDHQWVRILSVERSACGAILGYFGEVIGGWVCKPAGYPVQIAPPPPFGFYRAAVKNNNPNQPGWFAGTHLCCRGE